MPVLLLTFFTCTLCTCDSPQCNSLSAHEMVVGGFGLFVDFFSECVFVGDVFTNHPKHMTNWSYSDPQGTALVYLALVWPQGYLLCILKAFIRITELKLAVSSLDYVKSIHSEYWRDVDMLELQAFKKRKSSLLLRKYTCTRWLVRARYSNWLSRLD